jgi:hypothetical protein
MPGSARFRDTDPDQSTVFSLILVGNQSVKRSLAVGHNRRWWHGQSLARVAMATAR